MRLFFYSIIVITIISSSCKTELKTEPFVLSKDTKGIGPIDQLTLPIISDSIMKLGLQLFTDECSQCHTMEYKNTGPDISDILAIRKPEWVMNFLLNKEEMLIKDSLANMTLEKYKDKCGAEITKENDAFKILEYLRMYQIWLHEFNAL